MVGFVISVSIASGGYALAGFAFIWFVEGCGYKQFNLPIPFGFTAMVFASLLGFYEYIGQSIYNAFRSSAVDEQQSILNANNISTLERDFDQSASLTSIRQQLSNMQDIGLTLQQNEERRNSQLPPLRHINSPEEIPTLQAHIQSVSANTINDNGSTAASMRSQTEYHGHARGRMSPAAL